MERKLYKFDSHVKSDRTFEGYASTFGNIDTDGDIMEPGAYAKSIEERFKNNRIKILMQHDWTALVGRPVEMYEDEKGLFVVGKLASTPRGEEAYTLMQEGIIDSMSVGFTIPAGKSDVDDQGVRHIREAKLYEFSLVTFPANEQAMITGLKALRLAAAQSSANEREELEAEIKHVLALLKGEPLKPSTHSDAQPLVEFSKSLINDLRGIAK